MEKIGYYGSIFLLKEVLKEWIFTFDVGAFDPEAFFE